MHPRRFSWLAWLLAAWAGLVTAGPATAQSPAMIRIQPATLTLAPGQTAGLAIVVEEGDRVYGIELNLLFDPAVLQIVDANQDQAGIQVQGGPYLDTTQGLVVANQVDNEAGVMAYGMTLLAPAEPVSGSGVLLNLTVRAVAPGNSPLTLSAILASNDGLALPAEALAGSVTVAEGQSLPATAAPPTPPPTPVPDTPQGAGGSPVSGPADDAEPAPLSGEPGPSAPEAAVQTATARQTTSGGSAASPGLRPTGPAPPATVIVADAPEPTAESVGEGPEGAGQPPPPSSTMGPSKEETAAVAANVPPIEGGSGPASEINGPGSDGNRPTMGTIGALALGLALAGIAAFYLLRKFLSRER